MTRTLPTWSRELRAYDPKPGCQILRRRAPRASTPDVFIRRTRARLRGRAQRGDPAAAAGQPPLLSGAQDRPAGQGKSKAWLSECLASANWLVKALDQRARTIVKVVCEIVKRQQGFFERGVAAMKPMTLREVAEAIEMHEFDSQPGHLEQICAVRPRPVRAEIFLRIGRRFDGRGRRRRGGGGGEGGDRRNHRQ